MAAAVWTAWLTRSLARVRERDLLRVLRPILPVEGPGASPVKVRRRAARPRPLSPPQHLTAPAPRRATPAKCSRGRAPARSSRAMPHAPSQPQPSAERARWGAGARCIGPCLLTARLPAQVLVTPATHSAWMEAGEAAAAPGGGSAFAGLDEGPAGNGPLHDLTLFSTCATRPCPVPPCPCWELCPFRAVTGAPCAGMTTSGCRPTLASRTLCALRSLGTAWGPAPRPSSRGTRTSSATSSCRCRASRAPPAVPAQEQPRALTCVRLGSWPVSKVTRTRCCSRAASQRTWPSQQCLRPTTTWLPSLTNSTTLPSSMACVWQRAPRSAAPDRRLTLGVCSACSTCARPCSWSKTTPLESRAPRLCTRACWGVPSRDMQLCAVFM